MKAEQKDSEVGSRKEVVRKSENQFRGFHSHESPQKDIPIRVGGAGITIKKLIQEKFLFRSLQMQGQQNT